MKKTQNRAHQYVRSELERMRGYAGIKVPEISRRSGIPYRTLNDHLNKIGRMTVDDLLAWMDVCGAEEITIRRR